MTPQEKGNWFRRIFTVGLIGAAAVAGMIFAMPDGWWKRFGNKEASGLQVTAENIAQVQASPGKLTVTNMMLDGNPSSEKLKEVLAQLKKDKYGDRIVVAELDATAQPQLAASQGVKVENFVGHLDFHADGRKLGQLLAQTDKKIVEETIDRMLAGMLRRIDKDWLPTVPGMEPDRGQNLLELKPATPPEKTSR